MLNIINKLGKASAECECTQCRNTYVVKSIYDAKKSRIGDICDQCKYFICKNTELTQSFLQQAFNYNEITGQLTYRMKTKSGNINQDACIKHSGGYLTVRIGNTDYLAHRIIYLFKTGYMPTEIDHINHNRSDNSWDNLRAVNRSTNAQNTGLKVNSTTKINGVSLHKPTNKYRAYIWVNGKQKHLGLFNTIEEAKISREIADIQYGYHTNHGK